MNTLRLFAALLTLTALTACGVGTDVEIDGQDADQVAISDAELTANARFETFVGKDGQYYFHLIAGNGEKVLNSEGYTTASGAKSGITTVRNNGVIDSRYLLREAADGASYFVLVAGNGQIVAVSQMYSTKSSAERAIATVKNIITVTNASQPAPTNDARFQFFRGADSKYYFHVRAANGEIVLQSQGYTSSTGSKSGASSVANNGGTVARYSVLQAADGKFYFVLKATNGQVIARGETYETKYNAERAVESCAALLTTNLPR